MHPLRGKIPQRPTQQFTSHYYHHAHCLTHRNALFSSIYHTTDSTYVSVPADFGGLSVDAYISGIVAGILQGAGFTARVTAHSVALEEGEAPPPASANSSSYSSNLPPRKEKAVFLVKFAKSVLSRDANMG
jgi:Transport protein particle (TRAPP) component